MKLLKYIQAIIIVAFVVAVSIFLVTSEDLSVDKFVSLIPDNRIIKIAIIMVVYAIKSVVVVLPLAAVQLATGMLFPTLTALAVNTFGTFVTISISYCIGKAMGSDYYHNLIEKNPKLKKLFEIASKNEFYLAYTSRIIAVIPMNISAMAIGSSGMDYKTYISGAMFGSVPSLFVLTLLGTSIFSSSFSTLIASAVCYAFITIGSLILHNSVTKYKNKD